MSIRFTLEEAESLLPDIEKAMREVVSAKSEFEQAQNELQAVTQRVMMLGGVLVDRQAIHLIKLRRDSSAERLKAAVRQIQETGCIIKDLDLGLIDFPTLFRGEEVYLCWRMDESDIDHWHGVNEGFGGRKPIDKHFLDNHRGDSAT